MSSASREEALREMLERYMAEVDSGAPVHAWGPRARARHEVAMSQDATRSSRNAFDARLAAPGAMDAARFEAFLEAQRRLGLVHGARAAVPPPAAVPHLTSRTSPRSPAAAEQIASALERGRAGAIQDDFLAEEVGLSADERTLAAIVPGPGPLHPVGRLDMLITDGGFSFIEYNADSPAGLTDQILVERTLMALSPPRAAPGRARGLRTPAPHPGAPRRPARGRYLHVGRARGRGPRWPSSTGPLSAPGLAQVLAGLFLGRGHRTRIVDPGRAPRTTAAASERAGSASISSTGA